MRKLPPEEVSDGSLDIVLWLREYADSRGETFPDGRFSDIFLIFDMDPHDQNYDHGSHLKDAMTLFTESSECGMLLINYPMLQSYKHMKELGDESFLTSVVRIDGIRDYKHLVDTECSQCLKELPKYTADVFETLIDFNLRKMELILNSQDKHPSIPGYDGPAYQKLLEIQMNKLEIEGTVFVINTSLFIAAEIDPQSLPDMTDRELREGHNMERLMRGGEFDEPPSRAQY